MVPGVYAFQMIVLFNRGQMLARCATGVGFAMAMGLAAARFISQR